MKSINYSGGGIYSATFQKCVRGELLIHTYIGSTRSFQRRFGDHKRDLAKGDHHNKGLTITNRKTVSDALMTPLILLPRFGTNDRVYDIILRAVEQHFIELNRSMSLYTEAPTESNPDLFIEVKCLNGKKDALNVNSNSSMRACSTVRQYLVTNRDLLTPATVTLLDHISDWYREQIW